MCIPRCALVFYCVAHKCLQRQTPQLFVIANVVAVLLGTGGVIALAVVKSDESSKRFIANNELPIANSVILSFCVVILLIAIAMVARHAGKTRKLAWCERGPTSSGRCGTSRQQGRAAQEHDFHTHQYADCAARASHMPACCECTCDQHFMLVAPSPLVFLYSADIFRCHRYQRRTYQRVDHTNACSTSAPPDIRADAGTSP